MAESAAAYGISMYELISTNNFDRIRSQLNPLTLRNRQSIVYQKVCNKTLLGHACGLGRRDIVKYLLDECGADICERYTYRYTDRYTCLSPLRLSIYNVDVSMLVLLISRGVLPADTRDSLYCAKYAQKKKYFSIYSIVSDYIDKIEFLECLPELPFLLSWLANMNLSNAEAFVSASISGETGRMKTLLADCMDPKATNDFEENVLCLTILNGKGNAEHFLMNYRVFTLKDHVRALELCGAKFIAFQSDVEKGMRCWRKAIRIRTEYLIGISDKVETLHTDLGSEFDCVEHLDMMEGDPAAIYVQALIVFNRLLYPASQVLHDAFVMVAQNPVFENDLLQAIEILAELVELTVFSENAFVSPSRRAMDTIKMLLRKHFHSDPSNKHGLLKKFKYLLNFMNGANWGVLLRRHKRLYPFVYIFLLKGVLYNMVALGKFTLSTDSTVWIKAGISEIMTWHSYPYPTTLLHISIEAPTAFSLIPFIIRCSDDVNCRDAIGETPMHMVAFLPVNNNQLLRLLNWLADAGGHIDAVSELGVTPLLALEARGVIITPLKFLSLKCLAAQAIHEHHISIPDDYPATLVSFIKLHTT